MPFQITRGNKGRFRASNVEFEVVDASRSVWTGIRYRFERQVVDVEDVNLTAAADNISEWGEQKPA